MRPVVSDSSVLIHLAKIGQLKFLKEFYEKIVIPPAVWKEVVEEGKERQDALCVRLTTGWVKIKSPPLKFPPLFSFVII